MEQTKAKASYKKIEPASGAIIMANGIFLIGGIQHFSLLDNYLGEIFAILLFIAWIFLYTSLTIQFFHRDFLIPFLNNSINSFAIGTWIAGVSVLCNVFLKYFPGSIYILQLLAIFNSFLWVFFLVSCLVNFKRLFGSIKNPKVHGVILLSTVGTQSIVILLNNTFEGFPVIISTLVILLGIIFYVLGIILIINRFRKLKDWKITTDWANTNCIIHGALSITGLAIVTTSLFTSSFVTAFWLLVFILLVVVEVIEIIRARLRVKEFGLKKGIFTYHITQWSRNFTFGMFFAFTLTMTNNSTYHLPVFVREIQQVFMPLWAWVVLLALIIQLGVYIRSKKLFSPLKISVQRGENSKVH